MALAPTHTVTFAEAAHIWARVGLLSFGGPAGQIALMHRLLVDEKRWISERRFLHALNYAYNPTSLPCSRDTTQPATRERSRSATPRPRA